MNFHLKTCIIITNKPSIAGKFVDPPKKISIKKSMFFLEYEYFESQKYFLLNKF